MRPAAAIEDFAGIQHCFSESGELRARHAAQPHSHQPSSHLVIGNVAPCIAGDQEIDFFAGMFPGIAFFSDQIDRLRKRVVDVEKRYALEGRKSRCVEQGMQRRDSRSTALGQRSR